MAEQDVTIRIVADTSAANGALGQTQQRVESLGKEGSNSLTGLGGAAGLASKALLAIGAGWSVGAIVGKIGDIGSALLASQAQIDRFNSAFGAIGGGGSVASEMEFVRRTARELGIDLIGTADSYLKLSAAAQGTSLAGEGTRKIFTAVAQASTALGLSSQETEGALLAISQMMSKGTVSAEELRGQLGERLPGAFQVAARAMGVTTAELGEMLKRGEVVAEEFLPKFSQALTDMYGVAAGDMAKSATREVQRLTNAWEELKRAFAPNVTQQIGESIGGLANYINAFAEKMRLAAAQGSGLFTQLLSGIFNTGESVEQRIKRLQGLAADAASDPALQGWLTGKVGEAKSDQAILSGTPTDAYSQAVAGNAAALNASVAAMKKEAAELETLRAGYAALAGDLSGQHKQFQANLALLNKAREKGIIDEKTYAAEVEKLIIKQGGVKDATKERTAAEKEAEEQRKRLNTVMLTTLGLTSDYEQQLRDLVELRDRGTISQENYVAAVEKLIQRQPFAIALTKEQKEADEAAQRQIALLTEWRQKEATALADQLREAGESLTAQREENAQIGLNQVELAELTARRWDEKAALVDQRIEELALVGALGEDYDALVKLRDTYKETAQEVRNGGSAKAMTEAAEKQAQEWEKAAQSIQTSLTDALLRGFESGKGFADNLVATLKNMFNTLVLRPIIQAVVSPVAGGIGALLGTGGAQAATGAGGIGGFGDLSSIGSILSVGSGAFAAGASWLTGGATFLGNLSAAGSLIGTGSTAGIGAGLTMGLGTIAPIIGGVIALRSLFGKERGGPKSGGSSLLDLVGGNASSVGARLYDASGSDEQVAALASGSLATIKEVAAALGGSAGDLRLGLGFDTDPEGTASNRVSALLARGDTRVYNAQNLDFGRDNAALQSGLETEAARLVLAGLQSSDLPEEIASYLAQFNASQLGVGDIGAILETAKGMVPGEEPSLLDRALEDPGTYAAVSTEVAELVVHAADALAVHREALTVSQQQLASNDAMLTQQGGAFTGIIDLLAAIEKRLSTIEGQGVAAAAEPVPAIA